MSNDAKESEKDSRINPDEFSQEPPKIGLGGGLDEKMKPFCYKPEPREFVPRAGLLTKSCDRCGGSIVTVGRGIRREVCSDCGREFKENILR